MSAISVSFTLFTLHCYRICVGLGSHKSLKHDCECLNEPCSSHASATATCKQSRPKQGERKRPSKRHM